MNVPSPQESAQLLARCAAGDSLAEAQLFERYVVRLTMLARARLSHRLAARVDPEDIVLSAYRSFFFAARDNRFVLEQSGDLWRLLVKITLAKLYDRAAEHQAARRDVKREVNAPPTDEAGDWLAAISRDPSPAEVALAVDELEHLLSSLPALARQVVELRLQGYQQDEIAKQLGCAERTVRRWLTRAREVLQAMSIAGGFDVHVNLEGPGSAGASPSQAKASPVRDKASPSRNRRDFDPRAPLWSGDYLVQRFLGGGSLGRVYIARQHSLDRPVALKFLRKQFLRSERSVDRFLQEGRIAGSLRHPGIVAMHGLGRTPGGSYFLAMDLISGGPLTPIASADQSQFRALLEAIAQAAEATAAAHAQGVIHCDLKPANILREPTGRVVLTDFGLARQLTEDAFCFSGEGTPAFIAPEQVSDCWGPISKATDVFNLGATLYWLITGRSLHEGTTTAEILAHAVSGAPITRLTGVPAKLNELCSSALTKPIRERLADMNEFAQRLRDVLADC
jgi:RNA polymerase sigma factor (sigma-70 family)